MDGGDGVAGPVDLAAETSGTPEARGMYGKTERDDGWMAQARWFFTVAPRKASPIRGSGALKRLIGCC